MMGEGVGKDGGEVVGKHRDGGGGWGKRVEVGATEAKSEVKVAMAMGMVAGAEAVTVSEPNGVGEKAEGARDGGGEERIVR